MSRDRTPPRPLPMPGRGRSIDGRDTRKFPPKPMPAPRGGRPVTGAHYRDPVITQDVPTKTPWRLSNHARTWIGILGIALLLHVVSIALNCAWYLWCTRRGYSLGPRLVGAFAIGVATAALIRAWARRVITQRNNGAT